MMLRMVLLSVLGGCGQRGTPSVPMAELQACDAYTACVDGLILTAQERQQQRWQSDSSDRCFERSDDALACETQCLQDYADFVRPRASESGCDPFAVLERHRFIGRAYPKPEMDDAGEFTFSLVFVEVGDGAMTVEIGEEDGRAPATVVCSQSPELGFVCEGADGPRGQTVLSGSMLQRDTDLTGEFVLTEDDGRVVEWWFTAGLSD